MKKQNKQYYKATKYFQEGKIDKAIKACDEEISNNLKNSGTLNLKGLLLYLKGDLKGAIATWKINSDYNDDTTAKNYLADSNNDKERIKLFNKGQALLEQLKVDQALSLFTKCAESDFNKLNVSISIAKCYIKKGMYDNAVVYLTKALEIDRDNKSALILSKQLKDVLGIKLEINKGRKSIYKYIIIVASIVIICGGAVVLYNNIGKWNDKPKKVENKKVEEKEDDKKEEPIETEEESQNNVIENEQSGENKDKVLVNSNEIRSYIENKQYMELYNAISGINTSKLTGEEKAICLEGKQVLSSNDALNYFYEQGNVQYIAENYTECINYYMPIHMYGRDNYLYEHALFFLGVCNEKNKDIDSAKGYYEEYYNNYPEGSYAEEVLSILISIYKSRDLDKCKYYIQELQSRYPYSRYNNNSITELLEQIG